MMKELNLICSDIQKIERELARLYAIPRPTSYNKLQILELKDILANYKSELEKIGKKYCV